MNPTDTITIDQSTGEILDQPAPVQALEPAPPHPPEKTGAPSVLAAMAERFGMDRRAFDSTLRGTIMPTNTSNEQVAAFLLVAKQYDLNPFTKEIFAFPAKGGGIAPVVSVDGWLHLMNSHPMMDGIEFEDTLDSEGKLLSVTAKVHRKDRAHPVTVTEYMAECRRGTDVWRQWPARMLRHKAAIQAARYAFGFAGIMEPDEYERSIETPRASAVAVDIAAELKSRGATIRSAPVAMDGAA